MLTIKIREPDGSEKREDLTRRVLVYNDQASNSGSIPEPISSITHIAFNANTGIGVVSLAVTKEDTLKYAKIFHDHGFRVLIEDFRDLQIPNFTVRVYEYEPCQE